MGHFWFFPRFRWCRHGVAALAADDRLEALFDVDALLHADGRGDGSKGMPSLRRPRTTPTWIALVVSLSFTRRQSG